MERSWSSVVNANNSRGPCYMTKLPRDLWNIITVYLPVPALGPLACTCKFMNEIVSNQANWLQRIRAMGLQTLFDTHTSRRFFTDHATGVRNWKEYFIAFYLLDRYPFRPRPTLVPEELCTQFPVADADPELRKQFPSVCGNKVLFTPTASRPWYPSWEARGSEDGTEEGLFMKGDGSSFSYHFGLRTDIHSYEYHFISSHDFTAATLRELKSLMLLRFQRGYSSCYQATYLQLCPLPISFLDWAHCILDAIDCVLSKARPHYLYTLGEDNLMYCRAALALRHPRTITVSCQQRRARFRVRGIEMEPLMRAINQAFAAELADFEPLAVYEVRSAKQQERRMHHSLTHELTDGELWVAEPQKPRQPKEPRRGRGDGGKARGGGGKGRGGRKGQP